MSAHAHEASFEHAVLPLFEQSRASWLAEARAVAWRLGRGGARVSVDQVRTECPPLAGHDPRVMGAVFSGRDWVRVGDSNSARAMCHRRRVSWFVRAEFAGS